MLNRFRTFYDSLDGGIVIHAVFKLVSYFMPLVLLFSGTSVAQLDYSDRLSEEDYVGLYEVYEDYFTIGSSVHARTLNNPDNVDFILKNFNALTYEYNLKLPAIHPSEDVWNFGPADQIADFAREHGLELRGHTLLWGSNWMLFDDNGDYVDKEVFYDRLYDYFSVIIPRYDDIIDVWDVVNEACHWTRDSRLHHDDLYEVCGYEYLEKAFLFAKEFVGPDDKLFLNENKVLNNKVKQDNIYDTLELLLENDIPIDGIGIQGHVQTLSFMETAKTLDNVLERFKQLGVEIHITELDMSAYTYADQEAFEELPTWIEQFQIKKYKSFFEVLRKHSDAVTNVTFWGINDANTHLSSSAGGREDWPLLFDKDSRPKQSYYAVCDF